MKAALVLLVSCVAVARLGRAAVLKEDFVGQDDEDPYALPDGFLLGAGVSAFQAEGAWNLSGKVESIMDKVVHLPNSIFGSTNVDVAADHYNRYKEDLALAKEMKFTSHRFSISWSRVLPTGDAAKPNKEGVQFYHDYIDEVKRLGMEPMVSMVHFDQPASLEHETGGWEHPEMIDKYLEYADFLFATFGEKVKYWNTINEPNMFCNYFSTLMQMTGLVPKGESNIYRCFHNIIIAHTKTYRIYKEKYYDAQKGFVGASALLWPATPASTRAEDVAATELFTQVIVGTFLHPLVYGDYPPSVRYLIDQRSTQMGLTESLLPHFTDDEKQQLKGGATDFIALNVYSKFVLAYRHNDTDGDPLPALLGPIIQDVPFVKQAASADVAFDAIDDTLMHDAIVWTWQAYHKPIIISENGMADTDGKMGVKDGARAQYHSVNLRSLVRTAKEYGIQVIAYYAWALLDLYEFTAGYTGRPFGLVHVDYKDGSLNRTLKDSSKFFTEVGETRRVPYVPQSSGSSHCASSFFVLIYVALVYNSFQCVFGA